MTGVAHKGVQQTSEHTIFYTFVTGFAKRDHCPEIFNSWQLSKLYFHNHL